MSNPNSEYFDGPTVQGGGMVWDILNIRTNPFIGICTLAFLIVTIIIIIVLMTGKGDNMGFRVVMGLAWLVTASAVFLADYFKDGQYKLGTTVGKENVTLGNQEFTIPTFTPNTTWYAGDNATTPLGEKFHANQAAVKAANDLKALNAAKAAKAKADEAANALTQASIDAATAQAQQATNAAQSALVLAQAQQAANAAQLLEVQANTQLQSVTRDADSLQRNITQANAT